MTVRVTTAILATALAPAGAAHGGQTAVKVTLAAPTHSPRIGVKWAYTVRATSAGKPVAARITAQIVDPIGGVHEVDFGSTKKPIVNRPFTGAFRDYVLWTPESRGIPLTFRVTVVAERMRKVIAYRVTPRP